MKMEESQEKKVDQSTTPNGELETDAAEIPEDSSSEDRGMEEGSEESDGDWVDILGSGCLMKKVLEKGDGERPERGDVCYVAYHAENSDGKVVDKEDNYEINLGDFEVIQGLDFAIGLMERGELADVIVKARFAYGSLGLGSEIEPNQDLVYKVKLLDFNQTDLLDPAVSHEKRLAIGLRKKNRGNWWYGRNENSPAIHCYRRAIEFFETIEQSVVEHPGLGEEAKAEKLKTYNNLAAAQLKIKAWDAALLSINSVLLEDSNNVKALFRKSKILRGVGKIGESVECIKKALETEPDSRPLLKELSSLNSIQKEMDAQQKKLYKKMLPYQSTSNTSPKANKTAKWKWVALGLAAAALSALAVRFKL